MHSNTDKKFNETEASIRKYVSMIENEENLPIDIGLLENVKQGIRAAGHTQSINDFIDRKISHMISKDDITLEDDERDNIVFFLQDLLTKHEYIFKGSNNTIDRISEGLNEAINQNSIEAVWGDHIDEIFLINGIVRSMMKTYHFLRIIGSIPKVDEEKINASIEYLLNFSDDTHLSHHLHEFKKRIPDRKNQARKIYKHHFYHVIKMVQEMIGANNDEAQYFANIILENVFAAKGDRITGNIETFKLHTYTLKYFHR